MKEKFVTEEEYETLFITLTRSQVAQEVDIGKKVLDIATGSAYFAIEVARINPDATIKGIDIFEGSVKTARENIAIERLGDRIRVFQMDASKLDFPDESFGTVINYLGLEDIHMTRGVKGVEAVFSEAYRVLKPGGSFYFVAMPSDLMETLSQKMEVDVFSYICGATWLTSDDYMNIAEKAGFTFVSEKSYYTGKKLTAKQAREEIEYACTNVPVNYHVESRSFEDTWSKFGPDIEKYGMGHYSKTVLFELKK